MANDKSELDERIDAVLTDGIKRTIESNIEEEFKTMTVYENILVFDVNDAEHRAAILRIADFVNQYEKL